MDEEKREANRRYTEEALQHRYEQIEEKEYIKSEKKQREQEEIERSEVHMRKIQFKLAKKHEKLLELKDNKLEDIKSRNEAASKRFKTVSNQKESKEYETIRNFVTKEK